MAVSDMDKPFGEEVGLFYCRTEEFEINGENSLSLRNMIMEDEGTVELSFNEFIEYLAAIWNIRRQQEIK